MIGQGEILAPAGSMESLEAAVNCGADAVYIGGKSFSARQNATNFDAKEFKKAADFCHLHDVKLYATVNTIIHDDQIEEFENFIRYAAASGVDAFIVQDVGAAKIIKDTIWGARLHGSTQMTVHSVKGAQYLKELGFNRVVLSRELPEETIAEICKLGIETEVFVHGALCMCLSGQCYLSSLIGQRSANRGFCAQPCRLPYSAVGDPEARALSLKDLSLMRHLIKMKTLGVTSFKIEGRMKRPEYVASAVMACVQALDGCAPDMSLLKSVFSRNGFTDGYFTGKLEDMFGTRCKEDVTAAAMYLPEIKQTYSQGKKIGTIHFKATVRRGIPSELEAECHGRRVTVEGAIPEDAKSRPIDGDFIERQLCKLGGTIYDFGGLTSKIDENMTLSAASINAMRRNAIAKLNELKIKDKAPVYGFKPLIEVNGGIEETPTETRIRISDISQLVYCRDADMLIIPLDIFLSNRQAFDDMDKVIIEPPRFIADEEKITAKLQKSVKLGAKHLMCNNIAYIKSGTELEMKLHGDFFLNISNSYALKWYEKMGLEDATLSFEMRSGQIEALKKNIKTGILAYGYIPVMLTRNCPIKNEVGCEKCTGHIIDRMGFKNDVICHGEYVEILNAQPLYLADRLNEINNISFRTIYFTKETAAEAAQIIKEYTEGGTKRENITRGLYFRGVH